MSSTLAVIQNMAVQKATKDELNTEMRWKHTLLESNILFKMNRGV